MRTNARSLRRALAAAPLLLLLLLLAAGCRRGSAPPPQPGGAWVLANVRVIDVERGSVSGPRSLVIRGERIAEISELGAVAAVRKPDGARIVDGGGRFLLPGLVDLHVHLFDGEGALKSWMLPLLAAYGVTSVREMAARPQWLPALRPLRARGLVAAVAVVVGGKGGEVAAEVARAAAAGGSALKVFSDVPEDRWRQILDEGKRRSLPVVGHVPAQVSLLAAARAGQRGDEHLMQVFEACTASEARWLAERRGKRGAELAALQELEEPLVLEAFDEARCDEVARQVAATGQVHAPTLVLPFVEQALGARRPEDDPLWRQLSAREQARWRRILDSLTPQQRAVAARRWRVARRITAALVRAGVTIVAGTDAPQPFVYPGASLHLELELLVEAGMTPAAALRAATLTPAEVLGLAAQQGSVTVGKRADLLLLDGNPLDDIRHTRRIRAVIAGGEWRPAAAPAASR